MKYFTFNEFERSETAYRYGIGNDITDTEGQHDTVTSGYRCPQLNKAVGGVPTSMHLTGHAADISAGNSVDNRKLYQLAQNLKLPYFELIGKKYDFKWLHISYNPERTKRNPS